ncbi:hypothetical protein [Oceanobacillus rekensis]|uniref:hypothetical protein n=1 Tax=Oceanobacillus rekensis TaxID=937927 RepID=UPI001FE7063C|nr:hypothetical protein [Oceanobacillus rekensis]
MGKHLVKVKWIIPIGLIALFVLIGNLTINKETAFASDHLQIETSSSIKEVVNVQGEKELTHEEIVALTNRFMEILVQDIDSNYKVIQFDTKEELLNEFEKVTTKETAIQLVDFYYTEKVDGLYLLPTETPPWFLEENDYDMISMDASTVKVVQDNYTELDGDYQLELDFTYETDWKITNIMYN